MKYVRIERKNTDTATLIKETREDVDINVLKQEKKRLKDRLAEINEVLSAVGEE